MKINGSEVEVAAPVTVALEDLRKGTVAFDSLEAAFGPSSLGIIVVRGLPARFQTLRAALLSYSSYLANLPRSELDKLESPESKWLVGWSCGKETLKDGRYDTMKGSYYINPIQNDSLHAQAVKLYPTLPEYTAPNIWPATDVLPDFEKTFLELCQLIVDTATLVASACDRYAEKHVPAYQPGYLEHVVRTSIATKARLLHYFPAPSASSDGRAEGASHGSNGDSSERQQLQPQQQQDDDDSWCATHVDHGCLTGLTSAMYVDEAQHPVAVATSAAATQPPALLPELDASPDPEAGLYIHSRSGTVTKVNIPKDCLAFQTGEALEVITKGKFRAVPHFVKGADPKSAVSVSTSPSRVARNTLAVFTQPNLWDMVDDKRDFATFAKDIVERNH